MQAQSNVSTKRLYLLALIMMLAGSLACSSMNDVIGQRGAQTPTVAVFTTATPGGRISVWLATPTGQISLNETATSTPFGEIVAPAATATAAFATLQAATATAGATFVGPNYQPNDCPELSAPPPPPKPNLFTEYPEKIGLYLSAGGPPTILEAMLRGWNVLGEGAYVQADTDLTGDGVVEIIITLYDPAFYQPGNASPGQLLVYGCSQKGYRLLFSTQYSPETIIPEVKRVGDMSGDARAELAFAQKVCGGGQCTQTMNIYSWNSTLGVFKALNYIPMDATNGKIAIGDPDKDGILEVLISFDPVIDPRAGPPRRTTDIWDWDGQGYSLALTQAEAPVYRIHALHDADVRFNQGNWHEANVGYDRVRDNPNLLPWTISGETETLRAYATYKKILTYIAAKNTKQANAMLDLLLSENPPGTIGEGYATLGQTFMDNYKKSRDRKKACLATLEFAATRPDLLFVLNSYGTGNRTYALQDLCPFVDK